jgi:hypothetical protein
VRLVAVYLLTGAAGLSKGDVVAGFIEPSSELKAPLLKDVAPDGAEVWTVNPVTSTITIDALPINANVPLVSVDPPPISFGIPAGFEGARVNIDANKLGVAVTTVPDFLRLPPDKLHVDVVNGKAIVSSKP